MTKPTKEEIKEAMKVYLEKNTIDGISCEYDEQTDSYLLKDRQDKQVIVGPGWACSDEGVKEALYNIMMDARDAKGEPATPSKLAVRPGGGKIVAPTQRSGQGGAMATVQECQATEKATYSTGKGRTVASAKTNIAALMEAGGSLDILERNHRPDFIEYTVQAKMPTGQHVCSSMSIYKQEYLAKKAWEWIMKPLMDDPGLVAGIDEYGMPEFAEGRTIKVRMSDEDKSILVSLPAKIALWREMAREWQSAGRVCETKAYNRAADMILRANFMTVEEEMEEMGEIKAIKESKEER